MSFDRNVFEHFRPHRASKWFLRALGGSAAMFCVGAAMSEHIDSPELVNTGAGLMVASVAVSAVAIVGEFAHDAYLSVRQRQIVDLEQELHIANMREDEIASGRDGNAPDAA